MKSVELSPSELIATLNWLDHNAVGIFEIETPWSKKPILSIELIYSTTNVNIGAKSSRSDFHETASSEGIDLSTSECAFFSSGIVKPINWTEFMEEIDEISSRNLLEGDRPRRIVFNTVALNRRYYSVLEKQLSIAFGARGPTGWGVCYLTTTGILRELAKYD